jgi:transcriptional regulator with GAF, ATPase, and Fis domain
VAGGEGDKFVGPNFRELVDRMHRLAERGKSVLVFGPTGTGKEHLLREYIAHRRGEGKAEIVNCSAFPETLLDSELFGHVKGAFTGAITTKKGLIEDHDCLALDEIGDATSDFHARLLRVMEYGEYRPVGDTAVKKTNATFISATNKPWLLRKDLLWRFEARIYLPPLEMRRRDLVEVLYRFAGEAGIREITERCLRFLVEEYPWPGNVREVRFALLDAAEAAGELPLDFPHLPMRHYSTPMEGMRTPAGRVWLLDDHFIARAVRTFRMKGSVRPELSRAFWYVLLGMEPIEYPEGAFRKNVAEALASLVEVARTVQTRLDPSFEGAVKGAPTPEKAGRRAELRWFEERFREGKSTTEIAREIGKSPQAVNQQLKKLGISPRYRRKAQKDQGEQRHD